MSKQILIIYAGEYEDGSTATLAHYIAKGVNDVDGVSAVVKSASTATKEDFLRADGVMCGSGDYNGNPEPDMIDFFDKRLGAGMTSNMTKIHTMPFGGVCNKWWVQHWCTGSPHQYGKGSNDIWRDIRWWGR